MEKTFDLNKLIGIPFKINRMDFDGCDCRGIVWLYFKYAKNKIFPSTDGKNIVFRNAKNDLIRMKSVIEKFSVPVEFDDLREGDIVIFKGIDSIGALGVCINNTQVLHMDKFVGSCLTKISRLKNFFFMGYRPCLE